MGQVGDSQYNKMVMSFMGGESCRHIYKLKNVVVVICDPGVISIIAIGCGSSHRCHRMCMYIQRKAAKPNPPEAQKVKSGIGFIHMSRCSILMYKMGQVGSSQDNENGDDFYEWGVM